MIDELDKRAILFHIMIWAIGFLSGLFVAATIVTGRELGWW